jgi:hypothetical protein
VAARGQATQARRRPKHDPGGPEVADSEHAEQPERYPATAGIVPRQHARALRPGLSCVGRPENALGWPFESIRTIEGASMPLPLASNYARPSMSGWRPLSKRGKPDARLDEPTDGLPPYLAVAVVGWVRERVFDETFGFRRSSLHALQLRFKLDPPLNWTSDQSAAESLIGRMVRDENFGLDVLDYMLHHIKEFLDSYSQPGQVAAGLNGILYLGGSVWEVAARPGGDGFQLVRRAIGPVREAIESIPPNSRAHVLLVEAWNKLHGRNPDVSGAYREAIRAVEAVAKPVVLPSDSNATLGKMIAAMRDKPEKWETTIGTVDDVRRIMGSVWTSQLDRHGTDDESIPLNVSPEQADAAVHICLTLARLFVGGHVRLA